MNIIPAIDIIEGECVRLTQGDYSKKRVYNTNPVEVAKFYYDKGFERVHIVDLDGAAASEPVNLKVVEKIKTCTNLKIQFGGGIKSRKSIESCYSSGCDWAICGSVAVYRPQEFSEWLSLFGGDRVILGADVRNGKISVAGWREDTSLEIVPFVKGFEESGLKSIICTDISRDGMLTGPDFDLYRGLREHLPGIEIIVSGGVSSVSDIESANAFGFNSLIVGKAIYENRINMEELALWLQRG